MIGKSRWNLFISILLSLVLVFVNVLSVDSETAKAVVSSAVNSSDYLNATTKYLHLGHKETGSFDFNINDSAKKKGSKYYWSVIKEKGNASAVSINSTTGLVTAKAIGKAYIACKITRPDGTILRPEASVTVINNITSVEINNIAENRVVTTGETIDLNRIVLDTEAGAAFSSSGITRWEVSDDTAGVGTPNKDGIIKPVKEGAFKIRAVCFQSTAKYEKWLLNKATEGSLVTAASRWYTVTVIDAEHQSVVSSQSQLDQALADPDSHLVTISTKDAGKYIIAQGNYSDKTLIVDAPNADVENHAVFQNVIIKAIKNTTWIEYANGNIIYLDDTQSSIIIDENSEIKEIVIDRPNSTMNIIANGPVGRITLLQPAQVNLTGNNESVTVSVENTAGGSTVSTSVPLNVELSADADINLSQGSEGTTLNKIENDITIQVDNNSNEEAYILTDSFLEATINPGDFVINEGNNEEQPTPTPTLAPTATPQPTQTPTSTPKVTITPKPTTAPTVTPTITPKPTAAPTVTPKPTAAPTVTPTPTATPTPTVTPTPTTVPLSSDASLREFKIGSESVMNYPHLNVLYPNTDQGAVKNIKITDHITGIRAEANDPKARVEISVNNSVIAQSDWAAQILDYNDAVVVKITAENLTNIIYYKLSFQVVNSNPVAEDDQVSLKEDSNTIIPVLNNDKDADKDELTITAFTQGAHGTVSREGNSLKYTPAENYCGSDTFTYTVNDGNEGTDTATVNITVTQVNDAPKAADDTASLKEDNIVLIDAVGNDSDIDGDTLTISAFTQGAHGTVNKEGNSLKYTPAADYNGSDTFTYTVSDGNEGTDTATVSITVTAVNDAPKAADDTASLEEDSNVLIDAVVNDSDTEGDTLTISAFTQGAHGAVSKVSNSLKYTPAANYNGPDTFTYTVNDGNEGTDTATVSITVAPVNDTPKAADDTASLKEDSIVLINAVGNDSDIDGDTLTISAFTQGAHGTVSKEGNSLKYAPVLNYNGSDSFTYTINDGNSGSASATVNITVSPVNDAPVAFNDGAYLNEDSNVLIDVLGNDADVEGDTIILQSFKQGTHGTVTREENALRYTPAANYYGDDNFTYTISDGKGGTATAIVGISITAVNDSPNAVNDIASLAEDNNILMNVVGNDSDIDGDTLTVSAFTQGTHGTVVKVDDNSLRYTPAANYNGIDSFTYTISDGNGGTDTAAVNIIVTAVNDAPNAVDDTADLNEDSTVPVNVLSNDSDTEGSTLTITAITQGAHGSVAKQDDNSLKYTPAANYNGSDSFTYTVSDGNGGTDTATVSIKVIAVNDLPVAGADAVSLKEDNNILINVVGNDSDIDGDPLTISAFTQGTHGTVIKEINSLKYTPAANYNGTDSFTYTISDGNGGTDMAAVNITITAVNDAPNAVNDTVSLNEDSNILIDILGNDSDVEGDTLTISAITQGAHGTVAKQEDNSLKYTPVANFNGPDSFTYTVIDGNGGTATATVSITVTSVNDAPNAADDTASLKEDSTALINVLDNDSDVDGDTLTISAFTQGFHGTVVKDGNSLKYTPAVNYNGTDSFTYTVSDGKGGTDMAAVSITVTAVNDVPNAANDTVSLNEDSNILIDVLGNDSDAEGDTITITFFSQGAYGTVSKDGNSFKYTPGANYHGSDGFVYTVSDGNGGTDSATVSITVISINDVPVPKNGSFTLPEDFGDFMVDVPHSFTDADNDTLTLTAFTQCAHGIVVQDGTFLNYTPAPNYNGTDSFTYTVSDGNGGTATATITVTLTPVDDPPIAENDFAVLNEDSTAWLDVLSNDSEPDGDTLTITYFSQGTHGTVVQEGSLLKYTPTADFSGTDSFSYAVKDSTKYYASADVNIQVEAVNDMPVIVNDSCSTNEDNSVLINVLGNDTDVEGDPIVIASFSQGSHGSVIQEGYSLRYTPAANYNGSDSFTYTISDGASTTSPASVTITINPVNDAPVTVNDNAYPNVNQTTLINILGNDSDPEGDTITISSFTQGVHGTVTKVGNDISYAPDIDYVGVDAFTYAVSDGKGGSSSALVTIYVLGPILKVDYAIPGIKTGNVSFIISNAGKYRLQTSYSQIDANTMLRIYDGSMNLMMEKDDDNRDQGNYYSTIVAYLQPGTYYYSVDELNNPFLFCHFEISLIE